MTAASTPPSSIRRVASSGVNAVTCRCDLRSRARLGRKCAGQQLRSVSKTGNDRVLGQIVSRHHLQVVSGGCLCEAVLLGFRSKLMRKSLLCLCFLLACQHRLDRRLHFVLVEDLNSPNGGFLERFPFLATENFPATPADTPYSTDIYSIEYSGSSDFPQYPLNLLADMNASAGFIDLHPFLLPGWPTTFSPSELAGAVLEPTSPADGATEYFMIPTQDLPLLDGLRIVPGVGPAMADLIQPDLRVLVDLGYNWSGDADVSTPADWQMPDINWDTVSAELALGAQQGMTAAEVDLGMLPTSDLPNLYPYLPDVAGLQSGAVGGEVPAAASASSVPLADSSAPLSLGALLGDLNAYLPGITSELTPLLGSTAAAELSSMLSADLLPSLAAF